MGKTVRNIINIIWYLFVFAFIQIICWLAIWVTWSFIQGNDIESVLKNIRGAILDNEYALITNTIVCSLLTVCLFFIQDWTPFKRTYLQSRPWTTLFWVGLMVFGTIIPSIWLDEQLGVELSESAEQMLTKMMGNPLGYFAVGVRYATWCSTRQTVCSTWVSLKASTRYCLRFPETGIRSSSLLP